MWWTTCPIFLTDSKGNIENFLTNHQILIRYDAWARTNANVTDLEINITSDSGFAYHDEKHLVLDPSSQKPEQIVWQFIPTLAGKYTIEKFSDGIHTSSAFFSVSDSQMTQDSPVLVSPLRQFKWGILPNHIQCKTGLVLMSKSENMSPACVKSDTGQKLIERGWTILYDSVTNIRQISTNVIDESSPSATMSTVTKFEVHNNRGSQKVDYDSTSRTYSFVETDYFSGNVGQIKTGFPVQVNISDPYDILTRKITVPSDDVAHDGSFNFTCTFHGKFGQDVYTLNFIYGNQTYALEYTPVPPIQR